MTVKQRKYHSMKRILVAGGAGFIGSHLVEKMISDGNEVICLDNFLPGLKIILRLTQKRKI